MSYWLPYFNNYIKKNLIQYNFYEDYLILESKKLRSNIFLIKDNNAYQIYKLSNDKIILDEKILSLKINNNNIVINNKTYNKINKNIDNLYFYPYSYNILMDNYRILENVIEIKLRCDIYNEFIETIPLIYINKNKLNNYSEDTIKKYLLDNKFIGSYNQQ